MPDQFLSRTSPLKYFPKGTIPASCKKSGLAGENYGTFKSFLWCCSMRLSYAVTTIVFPSLYEGNREYRSLRFLRIRMGVCQGCEPQSARLVANTNNKLRQYLVKCLWQSQFVRSLPSEDQTATSISSLRFSKRQLSSYDLPLRVSMFRLLIEESYLMGGICGGRGVEDLGLLRWKRMLFIYNTTRNFFPIDAIIQLSRSINLRWYCLVSSAQKKIIHSFLLNLDYH